MVPAGVYEIFIASKSSYAKVNDKSVWCPALTSATQLKGDPMRVNKLYTCWSAMGV